jgi:gamma-butyrobetaine dioxygenase
MTYVPALRALARERICLSPASILKYRGRQHTRALAARFLHVPSSSQPTISPEFGQLKLAHHSLKTPIALPYTWLRDSCQCSECVDPSTKQKLHRTSDVPLDIKPAGEVKTTINANKEWCIEITWNQPLFKHDTTSKGIQGHPITHHTQSNHVSNYPLSYLQLHSSTDLLRKFHHSDALIAKPWLTTQLIASKKTGSLFIDYEQLKTSESTLLGAITQLIQFGLLVITGVPTNTPESGRSSSEWGIAKVVKLFSQVRETFYGDLWDVQSLPRHITKNVAYTDLDLDLHMDLM